MKSFNPSSTSKSVLFALLLLTPSLAHAQKKKSSGLITAEDFAKYPNDTIERIIARMVTGIEIVRADNGASIIQIRGAITLPDRESGAQYIKPPLYVVDGLTVRTSDGTLPQMEPQDLDSLRVLKGAATAAYGLDGGDGVILFYTKRGQVRK